MQKIKNFLKTAQYKIGISIVANQVSFIVLSCLTQQVVDADYLVSNDLSESLQKIKKRVKGDYPCYLVLPNHFAMIKRLQFSDAFKDKEINKLLKLNALKYFSYPIEALHYDFEYLNREENEIRVVASKKEDIFVWLSLFEKTQLNLKLLTFDVLTLEKFFHAHGLLNENQIYAIFLVQGQALVQVVISSLVVDFVNNATLEAREINAEDELNKFVRLYETSKSNTKSINEVILIGKEFLENTYALSSKWNFRVHNTLLDLCASNLPVTSLLPWGAAL